MVGSIEGIAEGDLVGNWVGESVVVVVDVGVVVSVVVWLDVTVVVGVVVWLDVMVVVTVVVTVVTQAVTVPDY